MATKPRRHGKLAFSCEASCASALVCIHVRLTGAWVLLGCERHGTWGSLVPLVLQSCICLTLR